MSLIFRFSAVHKVQFILCQKKITEEYKAHLLTAAFKCLHDLTLGGGKKKKVCGMPGQWG